MTKEISYQSCVGRMYSSVCTLGAWGVYSEGRQCSNEGRLNNVGSALNAAVVLSPVWSEAVRQTGCGTATSTAVAPTYVCHILTASPSRCIVGGRAVDSCHAI